MERLLLAGLVICIVMLGFLSWEVRKMEHAEVRSPVSIQTITTQLTNGETVETVRYEGVSIEAWLAEHTRAEAAALARLKDR